MGPRHAAQTTDADIDGPLLSGIRVVDATGPEAELTGRTLAELGADVIKVEPPGGTASRRRGPFGANGRSLYWAAVGVGKTSTVLDLETGAGCDRLIQLVGSSDVFVQSFAPGTLESWGLPARRLAEVNGGLVHVSVTPYGTTGPKAAWPGTELTAEAAAGRLAHQGDPDRPPIPIGHPQAYYHAGVQAAADAIVALVERQSSGRGQFLDVSVQAVMVHTLFGAVSAALLEPDRDAEEEEEARLRRAGRLHLLPDIWECADGYVAAPLAAGALPLARHITAELAAAGSLPAEVAGIDWSRYAALVLRRRIDDETARAAVEALAGWFRSRTKAELMEFAHAGDFRMGPLLTTADLLRDPHLSARGYWTSIHGRTQPGPAVRPVLFPEPFPPRPAPEIGEGAPVAPATGPMAAPAPVRARDRGGPFAGLKVADFSWVAVGPTIGRALADHGATVVRVESSQRLDVARSLPPFRGESKGINDSHWYAHFNASKLGLSLNLASDAGRGVAGRLVEWSDVVIESFSPGTMGRLGLDYGTLSAIRPGLIMLSASLLGQSGPRADFAGFGQQGVGLAGISTVTGWPDRKPISLGAYTDVIAPKYGMAALAAAIHRRQRTGAGAYLDLSQVEASIRFIEPLVLDQLENGRTAEARGLDSDYACPHGCYPAVGGRFIAIAVETPNQWQALCSLAPLGAFSGPEFAELARRKQRTGDIDIALAGWTSGRAGEELETQLCRAGVPAAFVARPREVAADPQLGHRHFFATLDHKAMGPSPYERPATIFSAGPVAPRGPAPCLGEHTDHVLADLLGYSEAEIDELRTAGALG